MSTPYTSPLARTLADELLERFLRYVRIDTQSRRDRSDSPSTSGQLELGGDDRPAGRSVGPQRSLGSPPVSAQFSASLSSVDGEIGLASEATIPVTDEGLLRG